MFNKKKKEVESLNPLEEATQKKVQERAQGLEDLAEEITQQGKEFIINSDILIGDYSSVMQLVNQKMGKWFNEQINDCKLSEILSLSVPEISANTSKNGQNDLDTLNSLETPDTPENEPETAEKPYTPDVPDTPNV